MLKWFIISSLFLISFKSWSQDTVRLYYETAPTALRTEYIVNNQTHKPDGYSKEYFENGQLRSHRIYIDGLLWNIIELRKADGTRVKDFGTYKDGNGTIKLYDEKDRLKSLTTYTKGILNGPCFKYYNSGKVAMKGNYYDGQRCGSWVRYDKEGAVKKEGVREFRINCTDGSPNTAYKK